MLVLAILLSFVHDVFDKVFVEADLRIVNGGKVLDKVSFRVNNQAVSPQVFFAHLTPMHQSLDIIHVTVVLHCCLVHLSQMLLVIVMVPKLLIFANLTFVDVRQGPFLKGLLVRTDGRISHDENMCVLV